ncbi:MAG TPA: c-type cytochrome [Devosiaceae bacterium]|nr:c-type cytochrome [Devosiaceae bacterium]
MKVLAFAGIALALAAGPSFAAGDATAGATTFHQCAVCHNVGPGATNKIGPALTGVVGRQPGSFAGFNYSQGMKDFGAKNTAWTPALLEQFLKSPKEEVPGTKMTFAGLSDQTQVDNVVAYLQGQ